MYQNRRHTNGPEMSNIASDSYISGNLHLKSVVTHELSQAGESFLKMLNTCSVGAEEAASAKYLLARLESAGK